MHQVPRRPSDGLWPLMKWPGFSTQGHRCLLTCGGAVLMAPTTGLASPTEIPQVRVPGRPHRYPTDKTAFRGTPRHSC